ncbi:hypothetical protein BJX99DRAFT_265740 [Aspergillus californicus]
MADEKTSKLIFAKPLRNGSRQDIVRFAQDILRSHPEDDVRARKFKKQMIVGNPEGFKYFKDMSDAMEKQQELIAARDEEISMLKVEKERLLEEVKELSQVRHRLPSNHKKELKKAEDYDDEWVTKGNDVAHEPKYHLDAQLYLRGERTDTKTYEELYDADTRKVLKIKRVMIREALDEHAADVLHRPTQITDGYEKAFDALLEELKKAGYGCDCESDSHPVAQACFTFDKVREKLFGPRKRKR